MTLEEYLEALSKNSKMCKNCCYCYFDVVGHCFCRVLAKPVNPHWFCAEMEEREFEAD